MQPTDLIGLVPLACTMQAAAIVRHQHVARLPAMAIAETVLDHVLQQLGVELLRLVIIDAVDPRSPLAAEIEAALANLWMGADQGMDDVGNLPAFGLHLLLARFGKEI